MAVDGGMGPGTGGEDDRCSQCDRPAVFRIVPGGRRLCSDHLEKDVEDRVLENITGNHLFSPGDHVAIAFSGGKDSSALLLILDRLQAWLPGIRTTAVTIDEGISGYREDTIRAAEGLARELGVRHEIVSFPDLFGMDLDRLVGERYSGSCTICGILRRRALNVVSRRIGATKIATGHNLDDEAQSVLMNTLRGDLRRLVQDSASGEPEYFIPRVKPLSFIPEKEVLAYLIARGHFVELPECPYADRALRSGIRNMLYRLEEARPGTRNRLMQSREIIRRRHAGDCVKSDLMTCRICGEVSSHDICQVCKVLSPGRGNNFGGLHNKK